jgi:NADPH-dependent glutamate synthase beta subunit-like oxidoreductase
MTRPPQLKERGTGPVRSRRPVYKDILPPCNNACPAGEDIQGWLALAQDGQYKKAWQHLVQNNPLPATCGRICYHPCENSCNRGLLDSSISIHAVERFLGDMARKEGWKPKIEAEKSGKRILVVGAGPSGLSAAFHLTRLGHTVEIYEAGPLVGGMMHVGIPSYRLPRDVLEEEVKRIEDMGVKIKLNHKVEDLQAEKTAGKFDAVFVAVGAHLSKKVDIPARDAGKIFDAISFLRDVDSGNPPKLGRRVAIYGGGNTAMDAARVARRLGVDEALIVYRRDREHMPALEFEADEALEEDVKIHWLRTIKAIDQSKMTVEIMKVVDGKPVPTGEFETLEADSLILALGQDTDTGFLKNVPGIEMERDGVVKVGDDMMTGCTGVFAGGDMVPSARTATIAIGHGKKAARNIDAWLRGDKYEKAPKNGIATLDKLHLWYYQGTAHRPQPHLDKQNRVAGFNEVVGGLSEADALFEAKRCLSCGNCFECDGCYGACPEDAIIKLGKGKRYEYNYELCTGCAICFEQCPCHAIELIPEPDQA